MLELLLLKANQNHWTLSVAKIRDNYFFYNDGIQLLKILL